MRGKIQGSDMSYRKFECYYTLVKINVCIAHKYEKNLGWGCRKLELKKEV
jgi:hypothetical protein